MLLKASIVIVVICIPSGTTKVLPARARAATIRVARYRWILPSSSTSLVSGTLRASPRATSNKRVLDSPLHLPPSPLGIASNRAATKGVLLSTNAAIVASHLAKQSPALAT